MMTEATFERLKALLDAIEKRAFDIPPPNSYTPDIVMGVIMVRDEIYRIRAGNERAVWAGNSPTSAGVQKAGLSNWDKQELAE